MSEVFIDSLTLENFGPFYGEHTFNFSNLDGRGGILVGGKNGAGKTHLLRALYRGQVRHHGLQHLWEHWRGRIPIKINHKTILTLTKWVNEDFCFLITSKQSTKLSRTNSPRWDKNILANSRI